MKKILLALVLMTISTSSLAWNTQCSVDDFTDERLCFLALFSEGKNATIGMDDDKELFIFAFGDGSTLYNDSSMLRVDDNDAIDLEEFSRDVDSSKRGFVIFYFNEEDAFTIAEQMSKGETVKVRLNPYNSSRVVFDYDLEGFDAAWDEFKEYAESFK